MQRNSYRIANASTNKMKLIIKFKEVVIADVNIVDKFIKKLYNFLTLSLIIESQ